MGNLVLTVTQKLWKKKPKLNMLLGKYIYNLYHIAWQEKYYLPLGVVMALRVQISCKKTFFFVKKMDLLLFFKESTAPRL